MVAPKEPGTRPLPDPTRFYAHCARCGTLRETSEEFLAVRIRCPNAPRPGVPHVASVIRGEHARKWLRFMQRLQNYEVSRYWPKSMFKVPESFLLARFIGLLVLLAGLAWTPWAEVRYVLTAVSVFYALWTIADTIAVNTSVAFVSRNPVNPLRSAVLAFFAFLHLVAAFALLNFVFRAEFVEMKTPLDALYFSIVTAATVGFGDIKPHTGLGRALIAIEIPVSLIFVAVLFSIFVTWTGEPPRGRALKALDDLPAPDAGGRRPATGD